MIKAEFKTRLAGVTTGLAVFAALLALGASVAGAAFSTPVFLSHGSQNANAPQVASDADGDAVAVWQRFDGSTSRIQGRTISADGARGTDQDHVCP